MDSPWLGFCAFPPAPARGTTAWDGVTPSFSFVLHSGLGIATPNGANRLQKLFAQTKQGTWQSPPLQLKHHLETSCTAHWRGDSTCSKSPLPFSPCSIEQQKICPPAQLYHSAVAVTKGGRAVTEITRQPASLMEATAGGRRINFYHTPFFFPLQAPSLSLKTPIHISLQKIKNNKKPNNNNNKPNKTVILQDHLYLMLLSAPLRNNSALRYKNWAVQGPEPTLGIDSK